MNIVQDFLTVNKYSRPGLRLIKPEYIVMHWVQNPRTTAKMNRNFWELRKDGKHGYGGGHFLVDDSGVIQCAPATEMMPHVGTGKGITEFARRQFGYGRHEGYSKANFYCLAVEMCHEDAEGSISDATWENTVSLVTHLCHQLNRDPWRDIITHEIVVGWKDCPRWFVDNPGELQRFQTEVGERMAA